MNNDYNYHHVSVAMGCSVGTIPIVPSVVGRPPRIPFAKFCFFLVFLLRRKDYGNRREVG